MGAGSIGACFAGIKVHFDEAGGLGAPELGPLDGEVEAGALGRELQAAVVKAVGIVPGDEPIHVFALLGGIPEGVQLDEAAQRKFGRGQGGRRHHQGQHYEDKYSFFHHSPL